MSVKSILVDGVICNIPDSGVSVEDIVIFLENNNSLAWKKNVLWDITNFHSNISTLDIVCNYKRIIEVSKLRKNRKSAFLVKDLVNLGLVRSLQNITEGVIQVKLKIFDDRCDAFSWLKED